MTDQTNNLEPCPFCGGEAESRQYDGEHFVQCIQCFNSTSADHQTEASAIAAWNRRASAPAADQEAYEQECLSMAAEGIKYWKDKYEALVAASAPAADHDVCDCIPAHCKDRDAENCGQRTRLYLTGSAPAAGSVPSDEEILRVVEIMEDENGETRLALCENGPLIRFARALLAQYGSPAWQPIETAPKDGRIVILRGPRNSMVAEGYWCEEAKNGEGSWIWPSRNKPVHWMPSPHEPTEGK